MGEKRFKEVVNFDLHITPYRIIEFIAGMGSGKNEWAETVLMEQMKVLVITSRKSRVNESKNTSKISNCLNLCKLETDAINYVLTKDKREGSCMCNNAQIEHYMKKVYKKESSSTHLWTYFDIIIIDEAHSLATDATFCDAPFYLYDFIKAAYHQCNIPIILFTATHKPIENLIKLKKPEDYRLWDFTDSCKNIVPNHITIQNRRQILANEIKLYKSNSTHRTVYFATKITNIKNEVIPLLLSSGVNEEHIAVSFSDETCAKYFSNKILANKERTERYLSDHRDIPPDIKFFITTSRNKEGINIENKNYSWNVIIESHWADEAKQMWGRVREGVNEIYIVNDASQHDSEYPHMNLNYIIDKDQRNNINKLFDEWCSLHHIKKENRYYNKFAQKHIEDLNSKFPFLKYSIFENKFKFYKGKESGMKSFQKSFDNYDDYKAYRLGFKYFANTIETPFEVKTNFANIENDKDLFADHIASLGYTDKTPLTKEQQDELLKFLTEDLLIRQKSDNSKTYTVLAKAVNELGYELKECSKHPEHSLYGCKYLKEKEPLGEDYPEAI